MRWWVGAVALALSGGACFMDSGGGGDDSNDDTGSGDATASASQTAGADSTSDPTGADGTAADATAGGSGESSGGQPANCWAMDPTQWNVESLNTSQLTGSAAVGMSLSGDGLSMIYTATVDATPSIFIATRASEDEDFSGGELFAEWATDASQLTHPAYVSPELASLKDGDTISTSEFSAGLWWPPVAIAFDQPPTTLTAGPQLFDEQRGMVLEILDGPVVGPGPTWLSYETRADDNGQPFGAFERVRMPDWPDDTPLLCPLPSPDGNHLFFGGAFPALWSDPADVLKSALDLWHSERLDVGGWAEPTEVDVLSHVELESCPVSITDDGCMMIINHFVAGSGPVGYALATR